MKYESVGDYGELPEDAMLVTTDCHPFCRIAEDYFARAYQQSRFKEVLNPVVVAHFWSASNDVIYLVSKRVAKVLQKMQGAQTGVVSDSKSELNRLIVIESYFGEVFLVARPLRALRDLPVNTLDRSVYESYFGKCDITEGLTYCMNMEHPLYDFVEYNPRDIIFRNLFRRQRSLGL